MCATLDDRRPGRQPNGPLRRGHEPEARSEAAPTAPTFRNVAVPAALGCYALGSHTPSLPGSR